MEQPPQPIDSGRIAWRQRWLDECTQKYGAELLLAHIAKPDAVPMPDPRYCSNRTWRKAAKAWHDSIRVEHGPAADELRLESGANVLPIQPGIYQTTTFPPQACLHIPPHRQGPDCSKCYWDGNKLRGICSRSYLLAGKRCPYTPASCNFCHSPCHFDDRFRPPTRRSSRRTHPDGLDSLG